MAISRLERATLAEFTKRIEALRSDSPRRWGKMSAAEAMAHLTRSLEIGLGEVELADASNVFTRTVFQWVAIDLPMNWPKGRIKAPPGFFAPDHGEFEDERRRLLATMRRCIEATEREPGRIVRSAMFGPLTLSRWSKLHGRHLDHHLRQFGV